MSAFILKKSQYFHISRDYKENLRPFSEIFFIGIVQLWVPEPEVILNVYPLETKHTSPVRRIRGQQ